jgi:hypothetical protein
MRTASGRRISKGEFSLLKGAFITRLSTTDDLQFRRRAERLYDELSAVAGRVAARMGTAAMQTIVEEEVAGALLAVEERAER